MKIQAQARDSKNRLRPTKPPLPHVLAIADNGYIHWSANKAHGNCVHQIVYGLSVKIYRSKKEAAREFVSCITHACGWPA